MCRRHLCLGKPQRPALGTITTISDRFVNTVQDVHSDGGPDAAEYMAETIKPKRGRV